MGQADLVLQLKLNNVNKATDISVTSFARNCRSILEIDLHSCSRISSESVTALLANLSHLRELRLAHCGEISDSAFLNLPPRLVFDSLRILDLTGCEHVQDDAIARIIPAAPRLRNLVLAKCKNITDRAVTAICKLTKNLHYIHLGHCVNLSDAAIIALVKACNRIRYIDLACCYRLTDASVQHLAQLPKLRRIGLVKCQQLTDRSILALARGPIIQHVDGKITAVPISCSLERVHLSYCVNLTLQVIMLFPPLVFLDMVADDLVGYTRTFASLSSIDPSLTYWSTSLPPGRTHPILSRCTAGVHSPATRCLLRIFWGRCHALTGLPE
jgi:F-box and leucine-rich repeat protein GRR1